ncbi:MAG: hypothetical protein ACJ72W_16825 [Actinoallomurus sp.]
MDQDQASVHQIEGLGGRFVASDVVAAYLDHRACRLSRPGHIDIGRQHPALAADPVSQPPRRRPVYAAALGVQNLQIDL